MAVLFECDSCGKKYRVGEDRSGTVLECRNCFAEIRVPGSRSKAHRKSKAASGPNKLVIGLLASIVVLLIVLIGAIFFRGDDTPVIADRQPLPTVADNSEPSVTQPLVSPDSTPQAVPFNGPLTAGASPDSAIATASNQTQSSGFRRVTSTADDEAMANQVAISGTVPRRVNSGSSTVEEAAPKTLSGPTPNGRMISNAPYIGAEGMGIRVPTDCIVDEVQSSSSGFSFRVRVPGRPPGEMNVSIRKNPSYTEDYPVKVVTETGPINIRSRGMVIMAQGGKAVRNLIDGINCWFVKNEQSTGFNGQMVGFTTGVNVNIKWSAQTERNSVVTAMETMARTFSKNVPSAKLPETPGFGPRLANAVPVPAKPAVRNTLPSTVPPPATTHASPTAGNATAWGNNSGTNIPLKDWSVPVTYSPVPSKYVAVENTIFNLTNGTPVLNLPEYNSRAATFSPSGAKYAVVNARGSNWEGNIVVHSVEPPDAEAIELVLDDRPYRYEVLRFLTESRLFVFGRDAKGQRTAAIWNLESLRVERRLDISSGDQGSCAVSKDGAFIAMASASELKVYSSQSGQEVAHMERPQKIEGLPFGFCNGLAFSPDMQELAALTMGKHVTVWSNRGNVVFECELSEKLAAHVKSEHGIVWMPDSSGWLLQGKFLLLKDGPTEGWWLKSERPYEAVPGTLTADNRAVGAKGSASGGFLTAVEIPVSAIRATVDAANKVPPLISEGDSISLDLEIESLRFATDEDARQALTEAFAARLKRGNIGILTGSKVSLRVRYREELGKERRIVKGPFAVFTQEEGIKAQDTNCIVEMSLVSTDRTEPLWSNRIESDAGILIDEEPNDKGLRNSAFGSTILRIKQLDLPLRVSGDPNASLPVITKP